MSEIKYYVYCYTGQSQAGYVLYDFSINAKREGRENHADSFRLMEVRSFDIVKHEQSVNLLKRNRICVYSYNPKEEPELYVANISNEIPNFIESTGERPGSNEIIRSYYDIDLKKYRLIDLLIKERIINYFDIDIELGKIDVNSDDTGRLPIIEDEDISQALKVSGNPVNYIIKSKENKNTFFGLLNTYLFARKTKRKTYILVDEIDDRNYAFTKDLLKSFLDFFPIRLANEISFTTWYSLKDYDLNIIFEYQKEGDAVSNSLLVLPERDKKEGYWYDKEYHPFINKLMSMDDKKLEEVLSFIYKIANENDSFEDIESYLHFVDLFISLKDIDEDNKVDSFKNLIRLISNNEEMINRYFKDEKEDIFKEIYRLSNDLMMDIKLIDEDILKGILYLYSLDKSNKSLIDKIYYLIMGEKGKERLPKLEYLHILLENIKDDDAFILEFKSLLKDDRPKELSSRLKEYYFNKYSSILLSNMIFEIINEKIISNDNPNLYIPYLEAVINNNDDSFNKYIGYLFSDYKDNELVIRKIKFIIDFISLLDEEKKRLYLLNLVNSSIYAYAFIPLYEILLYKGPSFRFARNALIERMFGFVSITLKYDEKDRNKAMDSLIIFIKKLYNTIIGVDESLISSLYMDIMDLYFTSSNFDLRIVTESDNQCYLDEEIKFDEFILKIISISKDKEFNSKLLEACLNKKEKYKNYSVSVKNSKTLKDERVDFILSRFRGLNDLAMKNILESTLGRKEVESYFRNNKEHPNTKYSGEDINFNEVACNLAKIILESVSVDEEVENKKIEFARRVSEISDEKNIKSLLKNRSMKEKRRHILGFLGLLVITSIIDLIAFLIIYFNVLSGDHVITVGIILLLNLIMSFIIYFNNLRQKLFKDPFLRSLLQIVIISIALFASASGAIAFILYVL